MFKKTILILVFIFYANNAYAAAWTKEKNEAQVIVSYAISSNEPFALLKNKKDKKLNYYEKREQKLYSEYGVTDNLTFGLQIQNDKLIVGNDLSFSGTITNDDYPLDKMENYLESIGKTVDEFRLLSSPEKSTIYSDFLKEQAKIKTKEKDGFAKVFFRQKLFSNGGFVMSLQPGFQFPLNNKDNISERINYTNTKNSFELRLSNGYSFRYDDERSPFYQYHFVNFDVAYKKIIDSFFDEIKLDLSVGLRMNKNSFMLLEFFKTYNNRSSSKYALNNPFKSVTREYAENAGEQAFGLNPKNNYFLKTQNKQLKISSVTKFSDTVSSQLSFFKTYTKFDSSSGVEFGLWFNL
jgi:hypothetical protein